MCVLHQESNYLFLKLCIKLSDVYKIFLRQLFELGSFDELREMLGNETQTRVLDHLEHGLGVERAQKERYHVLHAQASLGVRVTSLLETVHAVPLAGSSQLAHRPHRRVLFDAARVDKVQ